MRHLRTYFLVTLLALLAAGQLAQGALRHTYYFEAHSNNSQTHFIIKNGNGTVIWSTQPNSLDTYRFDNVEIDIGIYTMLINGTISAENGKDGVNAVAEGGGMRITFTTKENIKLLMGRIFFNQTGNLYYESQNNEINLVYGILNDAYFESITLDFAPVVSLNDFRSLGPDTYAIDTKEDLLNLGFLVNYNDNNCSGKTFLQTADIDFAYQENEPIGRNFNTSFQGTYDGQGHNISSITINRTQQQEPDCLGVFGYLKNGTVQNISLNLVSITGRANIGAIAGYNYGGTVRNCRVENTDLQAGKNMDISYIEHYGGVVGCNDGGTIIGCFSSVAISKIIINSSGIIGVGSLSGGIAGKNSYGTIRDCYFCGNQYLNDRFCGISGPDSHGEKGIFTNNYYSTDNDIDGVGSSDIVGACRAHEIQLKDSNFAIDGSLTTYNVSGLTAIGSSALIYTIAENYTKIYSGEGQTIRLTYTGNVPAGSAPAYRVNGTRIAGNSFTMPATDVAVKSDLVAAPPINVTGHFSDGVYWSTFRHGILRYALPEGAAAYTMDSEKHLYRLGDDGRVIPAGVAVVIIADKENITLTYDSGTADITDHAPGSNILQGSDSVVGLDSDGKVPIPGTEDKGFPYVLSVDSNGVIGFRQFAGTDAIPAHKAYYIKTP